MFSICYIVLALSNVLTVQDFSLPPIAASPASPVVACSTQPRMGGLSIAEKRQRKNAWYKAWRKANPDKVKAEARRNYLRHRAYFLRTGKQRYRKNTAAIKLVKAI
jgi:hypothetical protein